MKRSIARASLIALVSASLVVGIGTPGEAKRKNKRANARVAAVQVQQTLPSTAIYDPNTVKIDPVVIPPITVDVQPINFDLSGVLAIPPGYGPCFWRYVSGEMTEPTPDHPFGLVLLDDCTYVAPWYEPFYWLFPQQ